VVSDQRRVDCWLFSHIVTLRGVETSFCASAASFGECGWFSCEPSECFWGHILRCFDPLRNVQVPPRVSSPQ